jgi:hypothetical protein
MAKAHRRAGGSSLKDGAAEWRAGRPVANVSLAVSVLALLASGLTAWTARDGLRFNKQAQADAQKSAIFAQFQQQYLTINSQFPPQLTDPAFRPTRDSGEYDRLEAYWLFCFSEWYATKRVNPELFGDLWSDYYAPLIADGLDVPSLRYVLQDMIASRPLDRGEWGPFFAEIGRIARDDGHPLPPELEQRLAPYLKMKA